MVEKIKDFIIPLIMFGLYFVFLYLFNLMGVFIRRGFDIKKELIRAKAEVINDGYSLNDKYYAWNRKALLYLIGVIVFAPTIMVFSFKYIFSDTYLLGVLLPMGTFILGCFNITVGMDLDDLVS